MSDLGNHYRKVRKRIPFKEYKTILDAGMERLSKAIVESNAKVYFPYIGSLGVTIEKNRFKRKSINMVESRKLREAIIADGGKPLKYEKDAKGNIIGDNGGEEWLIYYYNPIICAWRIQSSKTIMVEDVPYSFTACRENKRKLHKFIESNTLKEAFYGTCN